jgi:flagellar assembly protein FliH
VDTKAQNEPPPPPTFSESELEQAKKQSFEQGRQQGLKESANSRDQQIAAIMGVISHHLIDMFAQERKREKIYEAEAVRLSLKIFETLFPLYHKALGFEELKAVIEQVLEKQEGQKQIHIHVHTDISEGVEAHIETLKRKGFDLNVAVIADETIAPNGCRMSWADGGAVKDTQSLADEIMAVLQQTLAASGAKGHDMAQGSTHGPGQQKTPETDTNDEESAMIGNEGNGDIA